MAAACPDRNEKIHVFGWKVWRAPVAKRLIGHSVGTRFLQSEECLNRFPVRCQFSCWTSPPLVGDMFQCLLC
jgi:hypothetical protein